MDALPLKTLSDPDDDSTVEFRTVEWFNNHHRQFTTRLKIAHRNQAHSLFYYTLGLLRENGKRK